MKTGAEIEQECIRETEEGVVEGRETETSGIVRSETGDDEVGNSHVHKNSAVAVE